jgi:hypothetical protein
VIVEGLRSHARFLALVVTIGLWAGCGGSGSGQTGGAFTFLSVNLAPASGAISNIDQGDLSTTVCARFQNNLKNPTITVPTPLDDVQITSYTVAFRRFDGGTPPGPFTIGAAIRVPAGTATAAGQAAALVIVVPADAKHEQPLRNPPPRLPLSTQADVVFTGQNGRGQRLTTQASLTVVFVSETTETTPACS